jgi:hypothetical protein
MLEKETTRKRSDRCKNSMGTSQDMTWYVCSRHDWRHHDIVMIVGIRVSGSATWHRSRTGIQPENEHIIRGHFPRRQLAKNAGWLRRDLQSVGSWRANRLQLLHRKSRIRCTCLVNTDDYYSISSKLPALRIPLLLLSSRIPFLLPLLCSIVADAIADLCC